MERSLCWQRSRHRRCCLVDIGGVQGCRNDSIQRIYCRHRHSGDDLSVLVGHILKHGFKSIFLNENIHILREGLCSSMLSIHINPWKLLEPLLLTWFNFNPSMDIKWEIKLLIHSQTSTVQPLKFGNGYVIPSNTLMGMWLLIHADIKVNPC